VACGGGSVGSGGGGGGGGDLIKEAGWDRPSTPPQPRVGSLTVMLPTRQVEHSPDWTMTSTHTGDRHVVLSAY